MPDPRKEFYTPSSRELLRTVSSHPEIEKIKTTINSFFYSLNRKDAFFLIKPETTEDGIRVDLEISFLAPYPEEQERDPELFFMVEEKTRQFIKHIEHLGFSIKSRTFSSGFDHVTIMVGTLDFQGNFIVNTRK